MKLLSVGLARAIWLFDVARLNPEGRSFRPVFEGLAARYKFAKFPQHERDYNKDNALAFESGIFKITDRELAVTLTIYNDGIWGDTWSSTDDADAFLNDAMQWLSSEHGMVTPPGTIVNHGYHSQVQVECAGALAVLNPRLAAVTELLSQRLVALDNRERAFEIGGMHAWTEDVGKPSAPIAFKFERKWGEPFSRHIYLSAAPLKTQDHLAVIKEIETVLSEPGK